MRSFDKKGAELSIAEFKLFQDILLSETGLYFSEGRRHQLALGLDVRLTETGIESYADYFRYLKFSLAGQSENRRLEIQQLIDELTVQETHFFRNGPQFRVLKSHVIPEIVAARKGGKRTIRIWSAGCATGQEPYSIAMVLMETLPDPDSWGISLLATDINLQGLEAAKAGVYDAKACEPIPKEYLWKYFDKQENRYAVRDRIKNLVHFDTHNLVTDPYGHISMVSLDIIFCRNVTIYFTLGTTKKVIDRFHSMLAPPGYLFLGHSESLWKISERFNPVEYPGAFIYLKEMQSGSGPAASAVSGRAVSGKAEGPTDAIAFSDIRYQPKVPAAASSVAFPPASSGYAEAVRWFKNKDYEKALLLLGRVDPGDRDYAQAQIMRATILSNRGMDDEAVLLLEEIVQKDALLEEAYCLLGTLYRRRGDPVRAAAMFNRALYVNSTNPLASYQLADIYLRAGETAKAKKAYQNTLRALEAYAGEEVIPMADDLTAALLSQICQREIDILDQS